MAARSEPNANGPETTKFASVLLIAEDDNRKKVFFFSVFFLEMFCRLDFFRSES